MATQEKPETSLTPQNWYSRYETQGPTYAGQRFEKHLEKTQPNIPIGSMGLGYLPTFNHKNQPNVGKYSIHGSYGIEQPFCSANNRSEE